MEKVNLKQIGLSNSEEKVYIALIEKGDSTRGEIVNASGIAGSKIYEILEKLMKKGLVSIYLKNNVKHFKPLNPKQIISYIEEKEKELKEIKKQTEDILPLLLQKFSKNEKEETVELLTGTKSLELFFREQVDELKKGEMNYVIGGTRKEGETTMEYLFQKIHCMREKKGIKTKMLYNINQKKEVQELYSTKKYPLTTTKFINHSSPVSINIYNKIVLIIIFGEKLTGIKIISQEVSKSFEEYFQLLWETSKK